MITITAIITIMITAGNDVNDNDDDNNNNNATNALCATGCSKETVNCNFFLTDLKITKIGITEPFFIGAHREVLIF